MTTEPKIRPVHFLLPGTLFAAFALLFVVSLSAPVLKPIYILEIISNVPPNVPKTSVATQVRFGLWGWCAGAFEFSSGDAKFVQNAVCSKPPQLGYEVDPILLNLTGQPELAQTVVKGLTYILILHPIACGLTLITSLSSLYFTLRPSTVHAVPIVTLLLNIVPTLLTTLVWVIDLVLVLIARSRVAAATNNALVVNWGNGTWLTFAAMVALWAGIVGLSIVSCYCCGWGSRAFRRALIRELDVEKRPKEHSLSPSP